MESTRDTADKDAALTLDPIIVSARPIPDMSSWSMISGIRAF
jgi:hypothetical protein